MPVKVVDSSAVAAVLFAEPDAEQVAARLQGARLVAPTLLPYDLTSVCLKKVQLYPAKRALLLESLELIESLAITLTEVNPLEVLLLAERQDGAGSYHLVP